MFAILGFLITRCDLFGIPVTFTFAQQEKSRSVFGGFCTILFSIFAIWSIIHSSQDLLYKQEPTILQTDIFREIPKDILLSPNTFPFGFGLEGNADDNFNQFIDETIYSVQVTLWTMIRSTNENGTAQTDWSTTPLEVERCTLDHFGKFQSLYTTFPVSDLYCLKQKQQSGLDEVLIRGTTEGDLFQYLNIAIAQCNNLTSNNTCASPEAIESRLDSSWFSLFYADLAINGKSYAKPDVRFRKSYYTLISTIMSKKGTLKLGHVEMTTDSGWLLKSERTEEYVKLTGTEEFFDLKPDPDGFLYQTIIVADRLESNYDRSYIKLQESLAQAQGLITTVMIALILCLAPYSRLKFYEALMNEIFHFNLEKDREDYKEPAKSFQREIHDINSNSNSEICLHKDVEDFKDSSMNVSGDKRKRSFAKIAREVNGYSLSKADNKLLKTSLFLPSKQLSMPRYRSHILLFSILFSQQLAPLEMKKESLPEAEAEVNFKSSSPLFMAVPSSKLALSLQKCGSQDNRPSIYSPDDSPLISPTNLLLREKNTKMISFGSQPSVNIDEAIKIEMKTLNDPNNDGDNDNAFFSSVTQGHPKEQTVKSKTIVDENKDEEDKQEGLVKGKEGEGGTEAFESYIQDSLDPQAMKESFGDQVFKLTHAKLSGKKASGFRRNNDKFNRLRRQFTYTTNSSFKLDISMWDLICSVFNKNGPAAQRMKVLRAGISNIEDRLDIFNLLKKLREIDKLKALLLEEDHRTLFNGLPKPEINLSDCKDNDITAEKVQRSQYEFLKGSKFVEEKPDTSLVLNLYRGMIDKDKKSKVDQKLIEIYDKMFNLQTMMSGSGQ